MNIKNMTPQQQEKFVLFMRDYHPKAYAYYEGYGSVLLAKKHGAVNGELNGGFMDLLKGGVSMFAGAVGGEGAQSFVNEFMSYDQTGQAQGDGGATQALIMQMQAQGEADAKRAQTNMMMMGGGAVLLVAVLLLKK